MTKTFVKHLQNHRTVKLSVFFFPVLTHLIDISAEQLLQTLETSSSRSYFGVPPGQGDDLESTNITCNSVISGLTLDTCWQTERQMGPAV